LLDLLTAILLGAVQGLAEFLPISSSGHLVLIPALLGVETNLAFDTVLHIGTLIAIFTFFWKDIIDLIKGFILSILDLTEGVDKFMEGLKTSPQKRFSWLIIVGSIPTAFIGLFLKDAIETVFRGTFYVGLFLIITGLLLYYSERQTHGRTTAKDMTFIQSIIIGICQGLAVLPGISRSGATISSGLCLGLEREYAARYSFLLSIPAVLGAGVLQIKDITTIDISYTILIAGFLSSVLFGYLAIKLLMKMIKGWSLNIFAYYCWIVGIITLIVTIMVG
jgi:undecaprenyl-diphosphatase